MEDVSTYDWFYEAAEYHYDKGIITGLTKTQFAPYKNLPRAQLVSILYRMHGSPDLPVINPYAEIFVDIGYEELSGWYGEALWWAWDNSIVSGYENGCFGPVDNITREQFCVILYRYAEAMGMDMTASGNISQFEDAKSVSDFAVTAIKWAVKNGVLEGKAQGTLLDPHGTTTRAEAAVIMHRFDLMEDKNIDDYKLIVDDKNITEGNKVIFHKLPDYTLLPFTAVLETLGAEIEWTDEETAEVLFNGKNYIFVKKELSLIDIQDEYGINLMDPLPGGILRTEISDDELLLDSTTFRWIIKEMGMDVLIDVDYKNHLVEVVNQDVNYDYQLIVEGQDISQKTSVKVYQDYVLIPFVSVMEALGAEVSWVNETFAEITFKEMKCSFDSDAMEIIDMNSGRQFILPLYGKDAHWQMNGRELFWDEETFRRSLECMDIYLKFEVDHDQQNVMVEYLADEIDSAEYKLIVLGQELPEGKYVESHNNYRYQLLPLTAIMKALGAEIEWTSDTIAEISFDDKRYTLDTENPSLSNAEGWDVLCPLTGGRMYYKVLEGELLLDAHTLEHGTLMELGIDVDININYEEHIIELYYVEH